MFDYAKISTRQSAVNPAGHVVVLTIAGSDSGGHAGIQADLATFAAHDVFGTTAITCLTAQNPEGVSAIRAMPAAFVMEQILQVERYFRLRALKTGMLFSSGIIGAVADFLRAHRGIPAVVDPVMVATSGAVLLKPRALAAVRTRLLPLAALVTPNLDEVAVLLGEKPSDPAAMVDAGRTLARTYGVPFLVKGGHLPGNGLTDVLAWPAGKVKVFISERISGIDAHGSGCTLSAAIAANLAKGLKLTPAVEAARGYLLRGMRRAIKLAGRRFINHQA
ncbi:MAG: bifunctional hydroxymethylpyrimidine kinase/phosphomethylpyrimidine kinase [Verrucomicrobia bacterium RIFCSPLOWO2_12_FULL_64_8]|nr:MAG: bifunctional hydroxymethylpyrimidine kinase/phosphomethylpyrimidine kinase [Verrucomicrobia bacterium RIFCSPLOWO2_12_FULL_64_8]